MSNKKVKPCSTARVKDFAISCLCMCLNWFVCFLVSLFVFSSGDWETGGIFTEKVRHLVARVGAAQIQLGQDDYVASRQDLRTSEVGSASRSSRRLSLHLRSPWQAICKLKLGPLKMDGLLI